MWEDFLVRLWGYPRKITPAPNLLSKIDQKQKELKQLRKEYKTAFSAISKSWKEQVSSTFPNLHPCDIDEYVGVDIVFDGKAYNIFISAYGQKLYCMFSYDRKDKSTYRLTLKEAGQELVDKINELFYDNPEEKTTVYTGNGVFKEFKKEDYDKAFDFFLKVVNTFASR